MTREEAIEQIYTRISKEMAYKEQFYSVIEALERLKEPMTLAELLGWEEGAEYEYEATGIVKVKNNILYVKSEKCSSGWCNFPLFTDEIEDLRQAKKVEKKETKEELLDELQKYVSSERIDEIIEKLRGLGDE